jgi:hypothetical protein
MFANLGAIIPDDQGGASLLASRPGVSTMTVYGSNVTPYEAGNADTLLSGDSDTTYTGTTGQGFFARDSATGAPKYQYPSGNLYATLQQTGAVLDDGTVVDSTGTATLGFPSALSFSHASYYALNNWGGTIPGGSYAMLFGPQVLLPSGKHHHKDGNTQKQRAPHIPDVVSYLPSHIEASASQTFRTDNFACSMDKLVSNTAGTYNTNCPAPSNKSARVTQHYRIREKAIVQTFREDIARPLDAIAFVGHSEVQNLGQPNEFSYGVMFYYPNFPGKNEGDESSWDVEYPDPSGSGLYERLAPECFPESTQCGQTVQPENKLLALIKDRATVKNLDMTIWDYSNDFAAIASQPGPPHKRLLLADKLTQQAKVMFFGSCAVKPQLAHANEVPVFLQMWDIHDVTIDQAETRERAIIVPVGNDVDLLNAGDVWTGILQAMVQQHKTVQQAVDLINATNPGQHFTVYGNHNVRLR